MSSEGEEVITEAAEGSSSQPKPRKTVVTLVSSDEEKFEVDIAVANQSDMIKNLILDMEDDVDEFVVPVLNVTGLVLDKVIQYWEKHAEAIDRDQLEAFDMAFVDMQKELLFQVLIAVNFLESRPLLNLLCKTIADSIKDMSVDEVREYFSIESDFTEEEERQVREENQWAFEEQ
ncbi:unnamed protein product [Musa hybrid cultivar]